MTKAKGILHQAIGKYKERERLLKSLSLMLANLEQEEEEDGNYLVKSRVIISLATKILPGVNVNSSSLWEGAQKCEIIHSTAQAIIDFGDAKDWDIALQILTNHRNKYLDLADDLLALYS